MESSPTPSEQPRRRQRAPTITIDTTLVCAAEGEMNEHRKHEGLLPNKEENPHSMHRKSEDDNTGLRPMPTREPCELRTAASPESTMNRPTSPHNVSAPMIPRNSQDFLSVPSPRSRRSSLDSTTEDGESALRPDTGNEADFEVEENKFAFSPGQLGKMLNPKSVAAFHGLGGLDGLERGLRTDSKAGSTIDEKPVDDAMTFEEATSTRNSEVPSKGFLNRAPNGSDVRPAAPDIKTRADFERSVSDNRPPRRKSQSILWLDWTTDDDRILILLTVAAAISLALGQFQTFDVELGPSFRKVDWIRDVAIFVALVIILTCHACQRIFAKHPRELDKTVSITEDGTKHAPALMTAGVGFSVGTAGTEVSRGAPAIFVVDDDYFLIMKARRLRHAIEDAVNDAVSKASRSLSRSGAAANPRTTIPAFAATDPSSISPGFLQFPGVNLIMATLDALHSRSTSTRPSGRVRPTPGNSSPPTRRNHGPLLPRISSLMAISFFISGAAAQNTQTTTDTSWRQRALDTLSKVIVSCAILLAPTIILLITGCIVLFLLWLEAEGTMTLFMLGMAAMFATIQPAPGSSRAEDDRYIRLAIGMAYILFMLAYCRLVVLRNRYGKGFCTIAVALGALSTITGMAIPAVREYWVAFTNLHPTFALSLAIPSSFFLGDLAVYIIIAVNQHGKDDPSTPSQLEAGGRAASSPSPRGRAYRLRNIPMRRLRSRYAFGGDGFDSDAELIDPNDLSDDESPAFQQESPAANRFVTWVSRLFGKRKDF